MWKHLEFGVILGGRSQGRYGCEARAGYKIILSRVQVVVERGGSCQVALVVRPSKTRQK